MSMLTVTASESLLPRVAAKPLAPTLGNAIAMIGAAKRDEAARPSVSIATYASFADLCRAIEAIDERFDRHLGVAIELPTDCDLQWRRLSRVANPGGRLAIVVPPESRLGEATSLQGRLTAEIAGWDEALACTSIDQALQRLLRGGALKRRFALRPEGRDLAPVLEAIARSLTA